MQLEQNAKMLMNVKSCLKYQTLILNVELEFKNLQLRLKEDLLRERNNCQDQDDKIHYVSNKKITNNQICFYLEGKYLETIFENAPEALIIYKEFRDFLSSSKTKYNFESFQRLLCQTYKYSQIVRQMLLEMIDFEQENNGLKCKLEFLEQIQNKSTLFRMLRYLYKKRKRLFRKQKLWSKPQYKIYIPSYIGYDQLKSKWIHKVSKQLRIFLGGIANANQKYEKMMLQISIHTNYVKNQEYLDYMIRLQMFNTDLHLQ
ncbi:unnamed protein product [Paramecium pentaurelia]|uniref:Uncharacterized protein n=1 Tax=Paramecium pentaurelia TaxID=43138 RepID=A0A8S1YGH2_9CILI|nr:unnamed protein product [Paramecium pentaurelia]